MPYTVYLKKNEEKRLLAGHSWVFANEVAKIEAAEQMNDEESGMKKSKGAVILAIVLIVALLLYGLK